MQLGRFSSAACHNISSIVSYCQIAESICSVLNANRYFGAILYTRIHPYHHNATIRLNATHMLEKFSQGNSAWTYDKTRRQIGIQHGVFIVHKPFSSVSQNMAVSRKASPNIPHILNADCRCHFDVIDMTSHARTFSTWLLRYPWPLCYENGMLFRDNALQSRFFGGNGFLRLFTPTRGRSRLDAKLGCPSLTL